MMEGVESSTHSVCTVGPLSESDILDLICAYLGNPNIEYDPREFSEGYLSDLLWETNRLNRDQVRDLWFDAVERGHRISERYRLWRQSEIERSGGPHEYYAKCLRELRSRSQASGS